MSVSEQLHKDAEQVWNRIADHPFVVELYQWSLPMEKFKTYILQDYMYLVDESSSRLLAYDYYP